MNIVVDLGGVVLTWNPDAIIAKVFADPEIQVIVRKEVFGHEDWVALDRGTLDRCEAIARAAQRTGLAETDIAELFRQVPLSLVPIPPTVDLLRRLRVRGHPLYCLSNMHTASIEHLEHACTFWDMFDGVVVSCRLHLCKPEPAIYASLLEMYGLEPPDTVFIDDTEVNLHPAAQLGLHTIKFDSPAQCEIRLQALGCI